MNLMRTEQWSSYAAMIDSTGGIWTCRWGDHQIKSIFAGLFWAHAEFDGGTGSGFRDLVTSYSHQEIQRRSDETDAGDRPEAACSGTLDLHTQDSEPPD